MVSDQRQRFLSISIFIAVHSSLFRVLSNATSKLICWQLFLILNISIGSWTNMNYCSECYGLGFGFLSQTGNVVIEVI